MVVFIALVEPFAPAAAVAFVLFVSAEWLKVHRGWRTALFAEPGAMSTYLPFANNDLYELWLPIALAVGLALREPGFAVLPLVQLACFWPGIRPRVGDIMRLARDVTARRTLSFRRARSILRAERWMQHACRAIGPAPGDPGVDTLDAQGVDAFTSDLAVALRARGWPVRILVTEGPPDGQSPSWRWPSGIPVDTLEVPPGASWGERWGEMVRYLESQAPCTYLPNTDWRHSVVCPLLSDAVHVIGVVFSDDAFQWDHLSRLGTYWNAVVTTSDAVSLHVADAIPVLAARVVTIPIGVRTHHRRVPPVRPASCRWCAASRMMRSVRAWSR